TDHRDDVLLCRQRHGADYRRARASYRVDDLARRAVDDLVVVRLQSDADLLSRHGLTLSLSCAGPFGYPHSRKHFAFAPLFSCHMTRAGAPITTSFPPTPALGRVALLRSARQPRGV